MKSWVKVLKLYINHNKSTFNLPAATAIIQITLVSLVVGFVLIPLISVDQAESSGYPIAKETAISNQISDNDIFNTAYPEEIWSSTRASSSNFNPARLEISKTVSRSTIFVNNSGLRPIHTRVTLSVKGTGYPGVVFNPQDIIFVMDNSDSMDENDNEFQRIEALKLYLETMIPPEDRAAVVKFSRDAKLLNGHHLTSNYTQILEDLPELWHTSGLTNLGAAIKLANQELIENGDLKNNMQVQILLTDGRPEPPENNVTQKTIDEAVTNHIKIYTVGLGEGHDADLLKWIAARTGGKYYYAREASELLAIYDELSNQFRNYTAGMDKDPEDNDPLVRDVIPNWITYDPYSFSIKPDFIGPYPGNSTKLEWNVSRVSIGETWTVSYNITSSEVGDEVGITVPGPSRVRYLDQNKIVQELYFDDVVIKVLPVGNQFLPAPLPPPPPPPVPPPPPAAGFPIPAPPPATPVPISLAPPVPVTAGATPAAVPVEFIFAGFLGLGLAERIKQIRMLRTRQKVAIGV